MTQKMLLDLFDRRLFSHEILEEKKILTLLAFISRRSGSQQIKDMKALFHFLSYS